MEIEIKEYNKGDILDIIEIWNEVIRDGIAFPQEEELDVISGDAFFSEQSYTGIAYDIKSGEAVGLYILHPNNVGRCGHLCNASYAVKGSMRGQHIGEALVKHSLEKAKEIGFEILQFNAVVKTNIAAMNLYKKLGFKRQSKIPKGFRMKNGKCADIVPHYIVL